MKTYDELLEEVTFGTLHPGAGRYSLLIYWSYNTQHKGILTRRSEDVLPLFLRAEEEYAFDPKEMWEVELVSPPDEWVRAWRGEALARDIDHSARIVRSMIQSAYGENGHSEGLAMPSQVRFCEKYTPEDADDEGQTPDEDPHHYFCTSCDGYRVIVDVDPLVLHQRYEALPSRTTTQRKRRHPTPSPDRAVARPGEQLYALRCDGGHHHIGSMIVPLNSLEDFLSLWELPIFIFHGRKVEVPEVLTNYCAARDRSAEERRGRVDDSHRQRIEARALYNRRVVRYLMEGGEPPVEEDE